MAINPKIKQKAEDIRSKIFGSEVRESLASGLEGMSEDVESIKGRQGNVENQFQDVLDETTGKDVISAPEIIAARGGHSNLSQRLLSTDQQLQQRPIIKLFNEIPTWDMLADGEIGAVIKPIYPYDYDFSGANGAEWDKYDFITKKYTSTSYANTNEPQLVDGFGVLKVDKPAEVQFSTLEQRLAYKLNFKDKGKYRIKIDMMRPIYEGNTRGNCGFTITPSTSDATNYPINTLVKNSYAVLLGGATGSTDVLVTVRKITNSNYATNQYIATNGGYAATPSERLSLPQGELITFELEISPTTIKLWVDGEQYLNVAEDLSFLDVTKANLVLFCGNMDLNNLSATAKFDNLVIQEG